MRTLTIITTKQKYLPKEGEAQGLFANQDACVSLPSPLLSELLRPGYPLYRLKEKNSAVFATLCLDDTAHVEKHSFVRTLIEDVFGNLGEDEKNNLEEIYLFAHKYDLDDNTASIILPLDQQNTVVKALRDQPPTCFGSKPIFIASATGKVVKPKDEPSLCLYFVGFSHEDHKLVRLLEGGKSRIADVHNIDDFFEKLAKSLSGWHLEDEWRQKYYKKGQIPEKTCNFKYNTFLVSPEQSEVISDAANAEFTYKDLHNVLINRQSKDSERQVNVVFFPITAIGEFNDLNFYRAVINKFHPKNKYGDANANSLPTIFVSYRNIMIPSKVQEEEAAPSPPFVPDGRYRFLDSSIWYRYVAIEGNFWENLEEALKTIEWAYDQRLYKKNVCREFLEFQNRMLLNSYLDNRYGSGHAMLVFPFTFHAESSMDKSAQKLHQSLIHSGLKWNLLLVDDYSNYTLREGNEVGEGNVKKEIIRRLISEWPDKGQGNMISHFDECASVDEAVKLFDMVSI